MAIGMMPKIEENRYILIGTDFAWLSDLHKIIIRLNFGQFIKQTRIYYAYLYTYFTISLALTRALVSKALLKPNIVSKNYIETSLNYKIIL